MNKFLSLLEITFRRDPNNFRPRINKLNSIKVHTHTHTHTHVILLHVIIPLPTAEKKAFTIINLMLALSQDTEQKKSGNYFFLDD